MAVVVGDGGRGSHTDCGNYGVQSGGTVVHMCGSCGYKR